MSEPRGAPHTSSTRLSCGCESLPTLFAAGMSLVDTAEGAFMSHAYGWAFASPVRKLYDNITVTRLSVAASSLVYWKIGRVEERWSA
jgi:high-affinity nickel permease